MKLLVKTKQSEYPIYLERGSIHHLNSYFETNLNFVVLTDEGVPKEYVDVVLNQCQNSHLIVVPQGEAAKSFSCYQETISKLLDLNIKRSDILIALGGGVVGDLGGFVASTYLRGISFINIPTTTLAQIDSSIGGKVAINVNQTKNILGAFYPPTCVIIDPNTLSTLPIRQFNNGLVEAIKAGIIADPELFGLFESDDISTCIDDMIYKALLIKKAVVEQDEYEQHIRMILNYGHTIGHAIESHYGLETYLHGECVAYGMLCMSKGTTFHKRLLAICKKLNLPTTIPYHSNDLIPYLNHDKKNHQDLLTIVLVEDLGKAYLKDIPTATIRQYLEDNQ